jgi:hypothetical protein
MIAEPPKRWLGDRGSLVARNDTAPRPFRIGGDIRQRCSAKIAGASVGRFMLPKPQGLIVTGLLEKLVRANASLARGTHCVPWRFSALAPERVLPLAKRGSLRPPRLWTPAGDGARDGAAPVSAAFLRVLGAPVVSTAGAMPTSALPDGSGDCAVEGSDEGGDGAADDEDVAAPVPASYVALLDDEHESSPTQASGPIRALAVIRLSVASMRTVPPGCRLFQASPARKECRQGPATTVR